MRVDRQPCARVRAQSTFPGTFLIFGLGLVLAALPLFAQTNDDKPKKNSNRSMGFVLSQDATPEDVGLPQYPGSHRRKDTSDQSSALQMGLWGGSSGFRLVLLKLESKDSPQKIVEFYRKALGRYGSVVDCGAQKSEKAEGKQSKVLDCDADHPADGSYILKAGSKERQHIVGVEPDGDHSVISLVFLENPNSEGKGN